MTIPGYYDDDNNDWRPQLDQAEEEAQQDAARYNDTHQQQQHQHQQPQQQPPYYHSSSNDSVIHLADEPSLQQYPHNPYLDHQVVGGVNGVHDDDDLMMIHDDVADRAFNTAAIHGHDDPQYDSPASPAHHHHPPHSQRSCMRRRPILTAVLAIFVVVVILGVSLTTVFQKDNDSSSANSSNGGAPNDENTSGESIVVGTTKDGPKLPVVEVPQDVLKANKDEFGSHLVLLYKQFNLTWSDMGNAHTPAGLALDFVTGSPRQFDTYTTTAQRVQRFSLATFYYATFARKHAFWTEPTDWVSAEWWLSEQHECTWEGVVCNAETNQVTAILLPAHALSGYLPVELAFMETLAQLDLNNNYIYMAPALTPNGLTVFGLMTNMVRMEMDDNYIMTDVGIPTELAQMTELGRISMSYNLLQGSVSGKVVGAWTKLTHLEMESNYLTGELPAELGQLPDLFYIYLRRNLLRIDFAQLLTPTTATPPYQKIFSLWLDDNDVVGTIPADIGTLTDLASLSITNTTLHGPIPTQLGLCTDLQRLWLYGNELTGDIPTQLEALEQLQVLELYDNQLTGQMPPAVCTVVQASDYEFKTLSADCDMVKCSMPDCCTDCY